ncbi:hypothetical protein ACFL0T_00585 [Candidatus Omnitrophota bacterium]
MKKTIFLLAVLLTITFIWGKISLAAVSEHVSPEPVVESVVFQREKAQQEYELYKARQSRGDIKKEVLPQRSAALPVKDNIPENSKKDMAIGIFLLCTAIILTLRLRQLSKEEKR